MFKKTSYLFSVVRKKNQKTLGLKNVCIIRKIPFKMSRKDIMTTYDEMRNLSQVCLWAKVSTWLLCLYSSIIGTCCGCHNLLGNLNSCQLHQESLSRCVMEILILFVVCWLTYRRIVKWSKSCLRKYATI